MKKLEIYVPDGVAEHASFIQTFLSHMMFKMDINRDRPFHNNVELLFEALDRETEELNEASMKGKHQEILDEASDVANVAMLIAGTMSQVHARQLDEIRPEKDYGPGAIAEYARDLWHLRYVPRWSIVPHTFKQNVAEHSFGVLWIWLWLVQRYPRDITVEDVIRVIVHDSDEAKTGDMPSSAKAHVAPEAMSMHELWLKLADLLEARLFLLSEIRVGNGYVSEAMDFNSKLGMVVVNNLLRRSSWPEFSYTKLFDDLCKISGFHVPTGTGTTRSP